MKQAILVTALAGALVCLALLLRDRQQLDAIVQFLGVLQVVGVEMINPDPRNLRPVDRGTKCQVGENRKLLRCVGAVHVHRRIGFGVTEPLRFADNFVDRTAVGQRIPNEKFADRFTAPVDAGAGWRGAGRQVGRSYSLSDSPFIRRISSRIRVSAICGMTSQATRSARSIT